MEAATEMKSGTERIGHIEMSGLVLAVVDIKGRTQQKLAIRLDDRSKVWGSRFANLCKGERVKFTAETTPSRSDPSVRKNADRRSHSTCGTESP